MTIPPDPNSVELTIKRTHLETFTWLRCCKQNFQNLDPGEFGWKLTDGVLKPLRFNVFTLKKMAFVINKMIFIKIVHLF